MLRTIGLLTITIAGFVAFGSGLFDGLMREAVLIPRPGAKIFLGGWNGMVQQGTEIEALICNQDGTNCRITGGQESD